MINIIELTNNFILKQQINELPLDLEALSNICQNCGYDLLSYTQGKTIIEKMGLKKYCKLKAFTIKHEDFTIIFYRDNLSYSDKLYVIAHELGHIELHHTYHGVMGFSLDIAIQNQQEKEANSFAYQLLAPSIILQKKQICTIPLIEASTLLERPYSEHILASINDKTKKNSPTDKKLLKQFNIQNHKLKILCPRIALIALLILFIVANIYLQASKQVAITPSGNKYHNLNCQYVIDKKDIKIISLWDARKIYFPCQVCFD